ncbi:MAG: CPBP family intramembrane glutamic endopeptidase [Anaerolineae bacterium]
MPSHWLFLAGLAVLLIGMAFTTVRTGQLLRQWTPPFNLLLSGPENVVRAGLVALCIGLGTVWGPGAGPLGWQTTRLVADLAFGAGSGLLLAAVLVALGQGVVQRWGPNVYDNRLLRAILPAGRREWPGVLLALLPAAALEELLFRSLPLGGLHWLIPAHWLMWPLALAFGLLHWPQGSWGVVGATLAGIAFSLLFLRTGSIWAPLAAHYVMNAAQVVAAKALGMPPLRAEAANR